MSHDLKINYDDLCSVLQSVRDYREALAEISGAAVKFLAALQKQKSETYKALSGVWKQKILADATELDNRLEILEDLMNRYINAMADYIEPTNFSEMTRVDKSDISYNLYQMENAGRNLQTICWDTGSSWVDYRTYIDPESPGAEWERAQQDAEQWRRISNYNKLQSFRDDIAGTFSEEIKSTMDKIWKIYYDNIEPFEAIDDKFAFEAGEYYLRWASNKDHFETVECAIKDVGRGIAGQLSDIWEGLELLGLASNQNILSQRVMGEADPEVEARIKGFEQGMLHCIAHPKNAVETIGQSVMDKLDDEGLAYGIGYIGTDVAIGALTQKALGGTKGAAAGKVVDVVDDKLDDMVGATGDMAHITNEATNLADDMGKLADEVGEIGGEVEKTINDIEIIDGKVDGKIPLEEYNAYREMSIHNASSDTMTLGKFDNGGPTSYINKAGDTSYFDLGNEWNKITKAYGLDAAGKQMFEYFNKPALDDAVSAGKNIRFSHNPNNYGDCALSWEWDYLQSRYGYTDLIQKGEYWYAVK